MELDVTISVLVLLPVALALVAGGLVLYRRSAQAGWRAAGMGSLALGVGTLVVFTLTLPVFYDSEGEAPEPEIVGGLVPTQSTDAPATQQEPSGPVSTGMMVSRPTTEELVAGARVIVLAEISSVLEEKWIGQYGEDGQLLPADDKDGLPFTDYLLQIESVLKGDGTVTGGGSLVLRMFGHLSNQNAIITPDLFTLPNPGDHLLFALGRNPDGTYGSGPEGLLNVDGEKVVYADGVPFAVAISPEEFMQDSWEWQWTPKGMSTS